MLPTRVSVHDIGERSIHSLAIDYSRTYCAVANGRRGCCQNGKICTSGGSAGGGGGGGGGDVTTTRQSSLLAMIGNILKGTSQEHPSPTQPHGPLPLLLEPLRLQHNLLSPLLSPPPHQHQGHRLSI